MPKPKEQAVQAFTVETGAVEELRHRVAAVVADYERIKKGVLERQTAMQAFTVETRTEEELEDRAATVVADYGRWRKEALEREIARDQERTESAHRIALSTAAGRTSLIPELLEKILSHLADEPLSVANAHDQQLSIQDSYAAGLSTLIRCKKVGRAWAKMISNSTILRRQLFLQPDNDKGSFIITTSPTGPPEHWNADFSRRPLLNPFFKFAFPNSVYSFKALPTKDEPYSSLWEWSIRNGEEPWQATFTITRRDALDFDRAAEENPLWLYMAFSRPAISAFQVQAWDTSTENVDFSTQSDDWGDEALNDNIPPELELGEVTLSYPEGILDSYKPLGKPNMPLTMGWAIEMLVPVFNRYVNLQTVKLHSLEYM